MIRMYDLSGKLVYNVQDEASSAANVINISEMPFSLYTLQVIYSNGRYLSEKIVRN